VNLLLRPDVNEETKKAPSRNMLLEEAFLAASSALHEQRIGRKIMLSRSPCQGGFFFTDSAWGAPLDVGRRLFFGVRQSPPLFLCVSLFEERRDKIKAAETAALPRNTPWVGRHKQFRARTGVVPSTSVSDQPGVLLPH
jgi:hypothetical protein